MEEGETLYQIEAYSGWLIDKLIFVTSTGRRLGPFGRSTGGNRLVRNMIRFQNYYDSDGTERFFTSIVLHGFSYSLLRTLDCPSWWNVELIYAAVEGNFYDDFRLKI